MRFSQTFYSGGEGRGDPQKRFKKKSPQCCIRKCAPRLCVTFFQFPKDADGRRAWLDICKLSTGNTYI